MNKNEYLTACLHFSDMQMLREGFERDHQKMVVSIRLKVEKSKQGSMDIIRWNIATVFGIKVAISLILCLRRKSTQN